MNGHFKNKSELLWDENVQHYNSLTTKYSHEVGSPIFSGLRSINNEWIVPVLWNGISISTIPKLEKKVKSMNINGDQALTGMKMKCLP